MFRILHLFVQLAVDAFHEDEGVRHDAAGSDGGQGEDFGFVVVEGEREAVAEIGEAECGDDGESRRGRYTAAVCGFPFADEEGSGGLRH